MTNTMIAATSASAMYFTLQPPRLRTMCAGTQIPASTSPKNSARIWIGYSSRSGSMNRAPKTTAATMPIPTGINSCHGKPRRVRANAEVDGRPSARPRSCRRARTASAIASMTVR